MTPALPYRSNAYPSTPEGRRRIKYPLTASSPIQFAAYSFEQELSCASGLFPPAPKNTPSIGFGIASQLPPSANQKTEMAIMTSLSQPSNPGADLLRFTGSFAIVPASWNDYQTEVVNFPGWLNVIGTNFRDPKPTEVNVRMRYDYFVVDSDNVLEGAAILDSGGAAIKIVTSKGAIPILRRTPWLATFAGAALLNDEAKSLVPAAGVGGYQPTLPTIEQYRQWCGVATAFIGSGTDWDETHPPLWNGADATDILCGQYRLANSKLIDYAGNIISRVTTYALVE